MIWWRGSKCDVPISDNEREILATYEAEEDRGIMHTAIWHQRMAQLFALRDEKEREQEQAE